METSYDYVIVGAGPAGSVLASRLTEHTDRSVLLLDAGGEVNNELGRAQGTFFMLWGGEADWGYQTTPQPELGGRSVYTPRGRAVAGSSAINVGVWTRGADADYDQWEALGLEGWNSRSAAEVFGRVEASVHAETDPRRGGDGPIAMEPLDIDEPIPDRLIEAFVEAGLGVRGDVNGSDPFVAGRLETIHKDRYRHTIADAYLTPEVRRRPHLTIVSNAIVTQVLFDGTTATGVRYTTGEEQHEVTATREVILSGGAINTPQILMHSGIGPGAQLQTLGIPVVKDAPGVGANLQDHIGVTVNVVAPEEVPIPEYPSADPAAVAQWRFDRTGPATYFAGNSIGFFTTRGGDQPEFELLGSYQQSMQDDQGRDLFDGVNGPRAGYSWTLVLLHPASHGTVSLTSADPAAPPAIDPGYLKDPGDVTALREGLQAVFRLTRTTTLRSLTEQVSPGADSTDEELEEFIRQTATTLFHPVGTARMGSVGDATAVVDSQLRVQGVSRLRVVDASVMPTLTSGHTMAPTIYIAERAAEFITRGSADAV